MKSRSKELLSRSISAMISAIEIYNKPNFLYREDTFAILSLNSWELLFKSKWLQENSNKINSLYVYESIIKRNGEKSKRKSIKLTGAGNPFTHSLSYLGKKLIEKNLLNNTILKNIKALSEIRDSSVHFYNRTGNFSVRIQEIGAATLKNFVVLVKDWFDEDLSNYNFYLMPLSFVSVSNPLDGVILNKEEKNFIQYVNKLEGENINSSDKFSVTVNIEVRFTKSKAKEALQVQVTNNPQAMEIRYSEEDITEKYPWDYDKLTKKCKERYKDFKVSQKYHNLRKTIIENEKYCKIRRLDPSNSNSASKKFFNPNILEMFDMHYVKR